MESATIDLLANASQFNSAVNSARAVADQASASMKKLQAQAEATFASTRTPLEQYAASLALLNEQLNANLISTETYDRAVRQLNKDLEARAAAGKGGGGGEDGEGGGGGEAAGILSKHGALGKIGHALEGRLPQILGLTIVSHIIGEIAEKTGEWNAQLESGEKTTKDIQIELFQTLPIVGGIWKAFDAIGRAIAPLPQDFSKQTEEMLKLNKTLKEQHLVIEATKKLEQSGETEQYIALQAELIKKKGEAEKEYQKVLLENDKLLKEANKPGNAGAATARSTAAQNEKLAKEARDAAVADAEKDARKPITDMIEELKKKQHELSMTETETKQYELAQLHATDADKKAILALTEQNAALEKKKEADKKAADQKEQDAKAVDDMIEKLQQESIELEEAQNKLKKNRVVADPGDPLAQGILHYKLQLLGATQAQHDLADALQETVDKQKKLVKDQEEAKKIIEDTKTPAEKYVDELKKIQDLSGQGLLTAGQAVRAATKARKEATGDNTGASAFGNVNEAADRAQSIFQRKSPGLEVQTKILAQAEKSYEALVYTNKVLDAQAKSMEDVAKWSRENPLNRMTGKFGK